MSEKPQVALMRCESYAQQAVDEALEEALALTGGLDFVKPGMKIIVKPNLLMKKHPDAAATTHPSLVHALCKRLSGMGAQVVVGDSPGGPFSVALLRSVYGGTGMERAVEGYAALNTDVREAEDFFPDAKVLKKVHLCAFLKDADAIINVGKLKTHGMMGYTGAVKNHFGAVPGTTKVEYHYRMPTKESFADMLVDLTEYVGARLNIIDGVWGMEGDGPSHGEPRKMNAIIVSKDAHAADMVGTALMGLEPKDVFTLRAAHARGLCPESLDGVQVLGETVASLAQPDYKKVKMIQASFADGKPILGAMGNAVSRMLSPYPRLVPNECVGCRECQKACPPQAIEMKDNKPVIDRGKCIKCFCCQELCPKGAMRIHRPWVFRLVK